MERNPERSLVRKMSEIMKTVKYIQKSGFNQHNNYSYIKEEDVLTKLREEMAERNLMIFPRLVDCQVKESGNTKAGKSKNLTTIKMEYTIADGDSGEEYTISQGGQGEDAGDKGIYKATTGANKYALLKLFMIPTGDDPENDGGQQMQQQPQQSPPPSGQAPKQRDLRIPSEGDVKKAQSILNWSDDQLLNNINALRHTKGQPFVNGWHELTADWKITFYDIMNKRIDKLLQGGQS
jgi:hypothetical protein